MQSDKARDTGSPFDAAHMRGVDYLQRVDRLIEAALDLPKETRDRFVQQACVGYAELELDANRLLASCEHVHNTPNFLDGTAAEMAAPVLADLSAQVAFSDMSAAAELSAPLAGRYTVVREIGRGG